MRESNELLKSKLIETQSEVESLRGDLSSLENKVIQYENSRNVTGLSGVAMDILKLYHDADQTDFYEEDIIRCLEHKKIAVKSGLEELLEQELVDFSLEPMGLGTNYTLTAKGKRFILEQ
ncbi:MAG: hypothetical protein K6L74_13475 [Neptuniibacter sp.]